MVGATGPQRVGGRERAIEMPEIHHVTEIGHFMDDDLGPDGHDSCPDRSRVEAIGHHGFRTHAFDGFDLRCRTSESCDRMPSRYQCANQRTAHGAGSACNENAHVLILLTVATIGR